MKIKAEIEQEAINRYPEGTTYCVFKCIAFIKGAEFANPKWIKCSERLPEMIDGEDYSENVLAIVEGYTNIQVMCLMNISNESIVWANCYGKIDGDAEFDDNYNVLMWMDLPKMPEL
ncbi:MAG: DUF551 domain-containing protein [Pedobacter sp.]|jgi:PII-like signaling protein